MLFDQCLVKPQITTLLYLLKRTIKFNMWLYFSHFLSQILKNWGFHHPNKQFQIAYFEKISQFKQNDFLNNELLKSKSESGCFHEVCSYKKLHSCFKFN